MQIFNRKSWNLFMIFTLIISLITPVSAFADDGDSPTIHGDSDNPTLTIHKFEQEEGTEQGESGTGMPDQDASGEPLEGVEFTLTQTHSFDPETNEWTEVSGEPFTKTTNSNGQIVFTKADGLELGRYKVQETDGPDHVILNDEEFYVDIPMTNREGTELNYDVHIYPKNETIRGDGEFVKEGEDGELLNGVEFQLYKDDGTPVKNDEGQEVILETKEGKINFKGLGQGRYYIQEKKTVDGYAINNEKIYFEVESGKQGKVTIETIDRFVNENGTIINYETPDIDKDVEGNKGGYENDESDYQVDRDKEYVYNITIQTPGDIDKYKTLGVTDTLDDRLSFIEDGSIEGGWEVVGTDKDNINFSKDGQTLIWSVDDLSQLTPGEDITITFTAKINPDAELNPGETGIPNEAELDFDNDRGEFSDPEDPPTTPPVIVDPTEGGLKIIKVDKSDNNIRLEGAEFKLTTDEAGEEVVDASGTVITVNGENHEGLLDNLVTNANGEILIEGLTPGTYYLHETKAPIDPDDGKPYRLLTSPVEIKIEADQTDNKEVTVENSKSGWDLPATGGIGTIFFTLVGLILMGGALLIYLRRDKKEQTA